MVETDEPRLELEELRATAHTMVDLLVDYLGQVEQRAVFPAGEPAAVAALFEEPPPLEPQPAERIVAEIRDKVLPWSTHVGPPRLHGAHHPLAHPGGRPGRLRGLGAQPELRRLLHRAGRGQHRAAHHPLAGAPAGAGPGGGRAPHQRRHDGQLRGRSSWRATSPAATGPSTRGCARRWRCTSRRSGTSRWTRRSTAWAWGGRPCGRCPPTTTSGCAWTRWSRPSPPTAQRGIHPACIVALAGTTNTGPSIPLAAAARDRRPGEDVAARRRGLRRGAWRCRRGGRACWPGSSGPTPSPSIPTSGSSPPSTRGPSWCGEGERLERSYGLEPPYLRSADRARFDYYVHSFEQSRRFRALKLWMSFKRYGPARDRPLGRRQLRPGRAALPALRARRSDFEPAVRPAHVGGLPALGGLARAGRPSGWPPCTGRWPGGSRTAGASGSPPPCSRAGPTSASTRSTSAPAPSTWTRWSTELRDAPARRSRASCAARRDATTTKRAMPRRALRRARHRRRAWCCSPRGRPRHPERLVPAWRSGGPGLARGLVARPGAASGSRPEPELKIAFLGDSGAGPTYQAVLELVKRRARAGRWCTWATPSTSRRRPSSGASSTSILGHDFPYFLTQGNHDLPHWPALAAHGLQHLQGARRRHRRHRHARPPPGAACSGG